MNKHAHDFTTVKMLEQDLFHSPLTDISGKNFCLNYISTKFVDQ